MQGVTDRVRVGRTKGPRHRLWFAYRKLHLFDVAVDDGPRDTESARVTAGDRLVTADVDGAILGLTICYDLRFPELYRALALVGALAPGADPRTIRPAGLWSLDDRGPVGHRDRPGA